LASPLSSGLRERMSVKDCRDSLSLSSESRTSTTLPYSTTLRDVAGASAKEKDIEGLGVSCDPLVGDSNSGFLPDAGLKVLAPTGLRMAIDTLLPVFGVASGLTVGREGDLWVSVLYWANFLLVTGVLGVLLSDLTTIVSSSRSGVGRFLGIVFAYGLKKSAISFFCDWDIRCCLAEPGGSWARSWHQLRLQSAQQAGRCTRNFAWTLKKARRSGSVYDANVRQLGSHDSGHLLLIDTSTCLARIRSRNIKWMEYLCFVTGGLALWLHYQI